MAKGSGRCRSFAPLGRGRSEAGGRHATHCSRASQTFVHQIAAQDGRIETVIRIVEADVSLTGRRSRS